jgi:hypothetical protein
MKDILNVIPAQGGRPCNQAGRRKTIRPRPGSFQVESTGEDSAHTYTMFELNLAPGGGVDLHSHPSPETFYVLEARSHSSASTMTSRKHWSATKEPR